MNPDEKMIKEEKEIQKSCSVKFYKQNKFYFKVTPVKTEKVSGYRHHYGIEVNPSSQYDQEEIETLLEIIEIQYNRIKKLVLAKILLS